MKKRREMKKFESGVQQDKKCRFYLLQISNSLVQIKFFESSVSF